MSSITGKRSSTDSPSGSISAASEKKRARIEFDFDSKFIAASQEDLDIGLLRAQNRRLAERIRQRQRREDDLRTRMETLEKKQLTDDTKLYVVNRYWNQMNDDLHLMLQRFEDAPSGLNSTVATAGTSAAATSPNEDSNSSGSLPENEETSSFVRQLANCDKEELDETLRQRVELSTRTVTKVLEAFDRIVQRNVKLCTFLKGESEGANHSSRNLTAIDETVRLLNSDLVKENSRLNNLVTSLHERHHVMSLKYGEVTDKMDAKDMIVDELKDRIDELEFELNKSRTKEKRLEEYFYEARDKLRELQATGCVGTNASSSFCGGDGGKAGEGASGLSSSRVEELKRDLEEQRELAQARLVELETMNNEHKDALKSIEKYKLDLQSIPETVLKETAEYKSLQSHFSVLYNESVQMKGQVEELRDQLKNVKTAHLRQIEQMESEELAMQKRLRNECMQLEDSVGQKNKEYEMLRLEFEQTLAANEQSGPIHREMRHLITSLQNHTQQLKGENARMKKKIKEVNVEITRLKAIVEQHGLRIAPGGLLLPDPKVEEKEKTEEKPPTAMTSNVDLKARLLSAEQLLSDSSNDGVLVMASESDVKLEPNDPSTTPPQSTTSTTAATTTSTIKKEEPTSIDLMVEPVELAMFYEQGPNAAPLPGAVLPTSSLTVPELEKQLRDLKGQLKKAIEAQRELKLLLDGYKNADKEKREKAQLMVTEKRLLLEISEMKVAIKQHQETERKGDRRKLTDEEYARKIAQYESVIATLQKSVTSSKQDEDALCNELEVTGQAFEDMREQNIRLMQQLGEKDDANFKLMSERIKSNQIHKMIKDEKELLTEQIVALNNSLDAVNVVVRKLEEKERILSGCIVNLEKEVSLKQQVIDLLKRKAIDSCQQMNDCRLQLEKYQVQIKEAQNIVSDKTEAWTKETFRTKRLNEEVQLLKRKYERAKKFEIATTADEVLQEEIRELKEELTCPSCKTKRKDAVLNKCFHVFCYDCLKTRYETRQRKCPKCNQSFSANDFHRLYLA